MSARPRNPYIAGDDVVGGDFVGRDQVRSTIEDLLAERSIRQIAVEGQRRIGKTSFLKHLCAHFQGDEFLPFYFDLMSWAGQPLPELLHALVRDIARAIGLTASPRAAVEDAEYLFRTEFLPKVIATLKPGQRLLLLFDEFDVMASDEPGGAPSANSTPSSFFSFLHRILQERMRVVFIYAIGRDTRVLTGLQQLLRGAKRVDLWVLERPEAEALVRQGENGTVLRFPETTMSRILALTGRHPYLTQLLCRCIFARKTFAGGDRPYEVEVADVDAEVSTALARNDDNLDWWWKGLTPEEQVFCSAFARRAGEGERLTEQDVETVLLASAPRLRDRGVEPAARDLVRRKLLDLDDGRYIFTVEMLRRWVQVYQPVREASNALDQQNPEAHQLFSMGELSFLTGDWPGAIGHARSALELNPRHFQALLLLGRALLENGELQLAVETLGQAYQEDPVESRRSFVRALILWTRRLLDERDPGYRKQALALANTLWEQLKEIVPEDPEVQDLATAFPRAAELIFPIHAVIAPAAMDDERLNRIQEMRGRVQALFVGENAPCGQYVEILDAGREWIPNLLYCFQLESADDREVSLQVFDRVGNDGGQLWTRAAHVLVQMSLRAHSAIPRVVDGGFEKDQNLAYIVTDGADSTLDSDEAMARIRGNRSGALQQFYRLVEALSLLHTQGIIHRNVWQGSIERVTRPDAQGEGEESLRLSRFEMSVLISSLLQRFVSVPRKKGETGAAFAETPEVQNSDPGRHFYLDQGPAGLLCAPPERLAYIYPDAQQWQESEWGSLEDHRSDVYGLGMIAFQWFVGPPPWDLVRRVFGDGAPARQAFESLHAELGAALERSSLPKLIIDLIRNMISLPQRERPRADEIRVILQQNYNALMDAWQPFRSGAPYLLAVLPERTGRELYLKGGLSAPIESEIGRAELCDQIEQDLRGGRLTFTARGFSPYVRSPNAETDAARYVFLGKEFAWFAVPFEERRSSLSQMVPQVLLVKYFLERHIFRPGEGALARILPQIDVHPWDSPRVRMDRVQDRPSWTALLESVTLTGNSRPWHQQVSESLGWLLRYQRVTLDAHLYPFTRVSGAPKSEYATLQYDKERDRGYLDRDALLSLYARSEQRRTRFVDFFAEGAEMDGAGPLVVRSDRNGRPDLSGPAQLEVRFAEQAGGDAILVRRSQGTDREIPEKGWLQPRDDLGRGLLLLQQERAVQELLEMGALLDQLKTPRSLRRPLREDELPLEELRGKAPDVIKAMLRARPFFALHGPPGTGKSTIASRTVEAVFRLDRSSRVLVAAQSHFALDNLAEKLLDRLGDLKGVIAVRVASQEGKDKVSRRLKHYFPTALAEQQLNRIQTACALRLSGRNDGPEVLDLIARLKDQSAKSQVEIQERIERGANLVFSTCGTATAERLSLSDRFDGFDRVIVEEAAKAWPTELAMPLVRGREWILIGDHKQLPAYQREEVMDLLNDCEKSADESLQLAWHNRERYAEVFELFKNLFERYSPVKATGRLAKLIENPLDVLTTQYRMHPDIAAVVSRAFYHGRLQTFPDLVAVREAEEARKRGRVEPPPWVGASPLIWIDMQGKEAPCWRNKLEVDAISHIARGIRIDPRQDILEQVAILAPYRDQIVLIAERLKKLGLDELVKCVHTVDSFQGKEADIVLVSLVRFNSHDPLKSVRRRLGHMAAPERLNVMLSRARRHLVLVGAFDFFEQSEVEHWDRICETITELGRVLRPDDVPGLRKALEGEGAQ